MQEVFNYIKFTFKLILTWHGLVALLVIIDIYAVYLFCIERRKFNLLICLKLIGYPFLFMYGFFMFLTATIFEKNMVLCVGFCIMMVPSVISFSVSVIKRKLTKRYGAI